MLALFFPKSQPGMIYIQKAISKIVWSASKAILYLFINCKNTLKVWHFIFKKLKNPCPYFPNITPNIIFRFLAIARKRKSCYNSAIWLQLQINNYTPDV